MTTGAGMLPPLSACFHPQKNAKFFAFFLRFFIEGAGTADFSILVKGLLDVVCVCVSVSSPVCVGLFNVLSFCSGLPLALLSQVRGVMEKKNRGNLAFGQADWRAAARAYTEALAVMPAMGPPLKSRALSPHQPGRPNSQRSGEKGDPVAPTMRFLSCFYPLIPSWHRCQNHFVDQVFLSSWQ